MASAGAYFLKNSAVGRTSVPDYLRVFGVRLWGSDVTALSLGARMSSYRSAVGWFRVGLHWTFEPKPVGHSRHP